MKVITLELACEVSGRKLVESGVTSAQLALIEQLLVLDIQAER
jgi:hypothetical protein